jgi:hypothetical protein
MEDHQSRTPASPKHIAWNKGKLMGAKPRFVQSTSQDWDQQRTKMQDRGLERSMASAEKPANTDTYQEGGTRLLFDGPAQCPFERTGRFRQSVRGALGNVPSEATPVLMRLWTPRSSKQGASPRYPRSDCLRAWGNHAGWQQPLSATAPHYPQLHRRQPIVPFTFALLQRSIVSTRFGPDRTFLERYSNEPQDR